MFGMYCVYCIEKALVHWVPFTLRKEMLGKWEFVSAELLNTGVGAVILTKRDLSIT